MNWWSSSCSIVLIYFVAVMVVTRESLGIREVRNNIIVGGNHDYADALTKSILFFEGQRSGKLPSNQRMKWRKDSALHDGQNAKVDLVGGYYDAGDNIKFNFPMAFTTTVLAWGVLEFGEFMGSDLQHAQDAIKWATDYFLKSTDIPNVVYVQVGEPYGDHNCWERPEDMDTDRSAYAINQTHPGSEVSGEIAAALAASSIVFKSHPVYSKRLLKRAKKVFEFASKYEGSYNTSLGKQVCPFYCDWGGYKDELVWAAAWLYKATHFKSYWDYIDQNIGSMEAYNSYKNVNNFGEFGWDDKHAGINILLTAELSINRSSNDHKEIRINADRFVCNLLPESPLRGVNYTTGGIIFKGEGSNLQNPTALSFLLLVYARFLDNKKEVVQCGNVTATPQRIIALAKTQVDYILGDNPMHMSYMVGYGNKFPTRIHHRGSSLPSVHQHPKRITCKEGPHYIFTKKPNPNLLIGAVVGGPFANDSYPDSRADFRQSEPTTYINAPLVGVLAYFVHSH